MKTILVTGGCGFIGSNYLNKFVLLYPQYKFINVDTLTYAADISNIKVSDNKNYHFEKINICNLAVLEEVFTKHQPTDIINFAAESHVDISIVNPSIFIETNIVGTNNLLLLAKKYNLNRFHQISTDEVYGSLNIHDRPFDNTSPLAPNSPYSASKASADLIVRSYHHTFGLNTVTTRCSNNYGPNQDRTKLIPKAILNLLSQQKVPVYGRGENIRDWIYVEDHIDAINLVFHKGQSGHIYNIGGNSESKNIDIINNLITLLNRDNNLIEFVEDRKGHDFRYAINNTQIQKELGWKPKITLEEGLCRTVEFYKNKTK